MVKRGVINTVVLLIIYFFLVMSLIGILAVVSDTFRTKSNVNAFLLFKSFVTAFQSDDFKDTINVYYYEYVNDTWQLKINQSKLQLINETLDAMRVENPFVFVLFDVGNKSNVVFYYFNNLEKVYVVVDNESVLKNVVSNSIQLSANLYLYDAIPIEILPESRIDSDNTITFVSNNETLSSLLNVKYVNKYILTIVNESIANVLKVPIRCYNESDEYENVTILRECVPLSMNFKPSTVRTANGIPLYYIDNERKMVLITSAEVGPTAFALILRDLTFKEKFDINLYLPISIRGRVVVSNIEHDYSRTEFEKIYFALFKK